jgi:hypothetical protein
MKKRGNESPLSSILLQIGPPRFLSRHSERSEESIFKDLLEHFANEIVQCSGGGYPQPAPQA